MRLNLLSDDCFVSPCMRAVSRVPSLLRSFCLFAMHTTLVALGNAHAHMFCLRPCRFATHLVTSASILEENCSKSDQEKWSQCSWTRFVLALCRAFAGLRSSSLSRPRLGLRPFDMLSLFSLCGFGVSSSTSILFLLLFLWFANLLHFGFPCRKFEQYGHCAGRSCDCRPMCALRSVDSVCSSCA